MKPYEIEIAKQRYAHANRQLLEVSTHLLSQAKHGFTIPTEVIDELLGLVSMVTHLGAIDDTLRSKTLATEVMDFNQRILPDHS